MKTLILIGTLGLIVARCQEMSDKGLARLLVDENTRRTTITRVVESRHDLVPLILSWIRTPPPELNDIDRYILRASMAEIFGRLGTKEAIPFLIENISLHSSLMLYPSVWTKSAAAVEE